MKKMIAKIGFLASALAATAATAYAAPCADYRPLGKEFSFTRYEGAQHEMNGETLPMTHRLLYRGILEKNPTFGLSSVLKGILLSPKEYLGSPMFWQIQELLLGHVTLENTLFNLKSYHRIETHLKDRQILEETRLLLKCAANKPFTLEEADAYAADLMNRYFFAIGEEAQSTYFDLKNPHYYTPDWSSRGFGNNAVDLVIGTAYDQIASLYGKKTLIFSSIDRGLDLGNWNLQKNNHYSDSWVDNGEINIPSYIQAKDFQGFQIRKNEREKTTFYQEPNNPIDWSFHRARIGTRDVVIVLDGSDERCVIEGAGGRYYGCILPAVHATDVPALPKLPTQSYAKRLPLVGVVVGCANGLCGPSKAEITAFMKAYGKTGHRELPADILAQITGTVAGTRAVKFVANDTVDEVPGIQIVSATYGSNFHGVDLNNAKAKVAAFCDGKPKCDFKVATKYLFDLMAGTPKTFDAAWTCGTNATVQKRSLPESSADQIIGLECADGSAIKVQGATWGGNVKKISKGNVTAAVAKFLNGKDGTINYRIETKYLGDPIPGGPKNFEIEWKCSGRGALQRRELPADATGKTVDVGC